MPRLFLKLFGAFWITTVLILGISIYASFRIADRSTDVAQMMDPREADAMLREILDTEGIAGLERWIADESSLPPGQTVYMIDEDGNDLLQREVPEFLKSRARRMWGHVRGVREYRAQGGRRLRNQFFPLIEDADGRPLLAMPGPAPLSPFGVLSSSALRWTVLGVAMIVSLASFWLLSRSLTRPALRISATAARLAAGDLSARVGGGYSNDEIGELAKQFDRMAQELDAQAELRRELFRNVSHELRAPLARLQIAAELLERAPENGAKQLQRVRNEVEVLENLTAQVLALARAEQVDAGAGDNARLDEVFARIAHDAAFEAAAREVQLNWPGTAHADGDESPDSETRPALRVATSATMLRSAIENVVRNAIQMTPAGGVVRVDTEWAARECVVRVTDAGPGVPEAELERIFQPFYRLDTNRSGSGIGLAITARVMRQIGGSVSARNAAGGGLVVTLVLPGTIPA